MSPINYIELVKAIIDSIIINLTVIFLDLKKTDTSLNSDFEVILRFTEDLFQFGNLDFRDLEILSRLHETIQHVRSFVKKINRLYKIKLSIKLDILKKS